MKTVKISLRLSLIKYFFPFIYRDYLLKNFVFQFDYFDAFFSQHCFPQPPGLSLASCILHFTSSSPAIDCLISQLYSDHGEESGFGMGSVGSLTPGSPSLLESHNISMDLLCQISHLGEVFLYFGSK